MPDWIRLKGPPNHIAEELQLMRVSGNVSEFQKPGISLSVLRLKTARKQWFSFRTNRVDEKSHTGASEDLLQEARAVLRNIH